MPRGFTKLAPHRVGDVAAVEDPTRRVRGDVPIRKSRTPRRAREFFVTSSSRCGIAALDDGAGAERVGGQIPPQVGTRRVLLRPERRSRFLGGRGAPAPRRAGTGSRRVRGPRPSFVSGKPSRWPALAPSSTEDLVTVDARDRFLSALHGVEDPERSGRSSGGVHHVFDQAAQERGWADLLARGPLSRP